MFSQLDNYRHYSHSWVQTRPRKLYLHNKSEASESIHMPSYEDMISTQTYKVAAYF